MTPFGKHTRFVVPVSGGLGAALLLGLESALGAGTEVLASLALPLAVLLVTALGVIWVERSQAKARERRLIELGATLRHNEAELEKLASTDALTGLLNRRVFYDRLAEEFRRSVRYERPLSVLLLDLDYFKKVNDTYGHSAGDFVLAEFADILRHTVRDIDVVTRYGGEEFIVMLPEADAGAATMTAERIRQAVKARVFATGKASLRMTVSQGLATTPCAAIRTEDEMVQAADAALYDAKRGGRDRVNVFTTADPVARSA